MPRGQSVLVFTVAAAVAIVAAAWQFGDSSHAMGLLTIRGGRAMHPFHLSTGHSRYILIMTGKVIPPVRGDIRVTLEGTPVMDYAIYDSVPVVSLGLHRRPRLDGKLLRDVRPGDRLALWVVMAPRNTTESAPPSDPAARSGHHPLSLNFYAEKNRQKLLQLPVAFGDRSHGGGDGR